MKFVLTFIFLIYPPLILQPSSQTSLKPLHLSLSLSAFIHANAASFRILTQLPILSFHINSFHLQPLPHPKQLIILFLTKPFNDFLLLLRSNSNLIIQKKGRIYKMLKFTTYSQIRRSQNIENLLHVRCCNYFKIESEEQTLIGKRKC